MDKIKEVMTAFNEACSASYEAGVIGGIGSVGTIRRAREKQVAAMAEFEDKLRELLEREPLSEEDIFNIYCSSDSVLHTTTANLKAFARAIERAHGIGSESKDDVMKLRKCECGGIPEVLEIWDDDLKQCESYILKCIDCARWTDDFKTKQEAIDAWQDRWVF